MKNTFYLLFAILMFMNAACLKKNDDMTSRDIFTWRTYGYLNHAWTVSAYKHADHIEVSGARHYGFFEGSDYCIIRIPNGVLPGTMKIGKSPGVSGSAGDDKGNKYDTENGPGGTLVLQALDDTHVKGTFQFIAYGNSSGSKQVVISEGNFNVRFQ